MQTLKLVYNYIEWVFASFWGLTVIDFFAIYKPLKFNIEELISHSVQSLYIVIGLVYFVLNGVYRHQTKQLEREAKRLANRRSELENENIEHRRKKN